tara:strand:- start:215 stop:1678 length:1464 start_codon:yes stop_codon:yes gene_type:complete
MDRRDRRERDGGGDLGGDREATENRNAQNNRTTSIEEGRYQFGDRMTEEQERMAQRFTDRDEFGDVDEGTQIENQKAIEDGRPSDDIVSVGGNFVENTSRFDPTPTSLPGYQSPHLIHGAFAGPMPASATTGPQTPFSTGGQAAHPDYIPGLHPESMMYTGPAGDVNTVGLNPFAPQSTSGLSEQQRSFIERMGGAGTPSGGGQQQLTAPPPTQVPLPPPVMAPDTPPPAPVSVDTGAGVMANLTESQLAGTSPLPQVSSQFLESLPRRQDSPAPGPTAEDFQAMLAPQAAPPPEPEGRAEGGQVGERLEIPSPSEVEPAPPEIREIVVQGLTGELPQSTTSQLFAEIEALYPGLVMEIANQIRADRQAMSGFNNVSSEGYIPFHNDGMPEATGSVDDRLAVAAPPGYSDEEVKAGLQRALATGGKVPIGAVVRGGEYVINPSDTQSRIEEIADAATMAAAKNPDLAGGSAWKATTEELENMRARNA